MPDIAKIKRLQKSSIFGKYIYHLPEIDSTNAYAQRLAFEGAPEGTVVITDYQTEGRGRMGHVWESAKGANILMSFVLRPSLNIDRVIKITLGTANIMISALRKCAQILPHQSIDFSVKWPNDIIANNKKIAGILTESSLREKEVIFVIVGIGLNVNQDISALDGEFKNSATSLRQETGSYFEREPIIAEIISNFERCYFAMERNDYSDVIPDWRKLCNCEGRKIEIVTHAGTERGRFIDVNDAGLLIYATESGLQKELVSGSIRYL